MVGRKRRRLAVGRCNYSAAERRLKVGRPFKAGVEKTTTPIASRSDAMKPYPWVQAVNDLLTLNRPYGTKKAE